MHLSKCMDVQLFIIKYNNYALKIQNFLIGKFKLKTLIKNYQIASKAKS